MLEVGHVLRTWSLDVCPRNWTMPSCSERLSQVADTDTVVARRIGDHRLAYLDYEGAVGGDRGTVQRVDAGTYDEIRQSPTIWEVEVRGRALRGTIVLESKTSNDECWQLTYQPAQRSTG
jgi:hypothetical protein